MYAVHAEHTVLSKLINVYDKENWTENNTLCWRRPDLQACKQHQRYGV